MAADVAGLLDRLPMLGDLLAAAPDRIKQKLFDAFDIQALYSKAHNQVTFWATITPSTPATLAAIIADTVIRADGCLSSGRRLSADGFLRVLREPG